MRLSAIVGLACASSAFATQNILPNFQYMTPQIREEVMMRNAWFGRPEFYGDNEYNSCPRGHEERIEEVEYKGEDLQIKLCEFPGYGIHRSTIWVNVDIAGDFKRMVEDAESEGVELISASAYRSFRQQLRLYRIKRQLAAVPGRSNHEIGAALDFAGIEKCAEREDEICMDKRNKAWQWLDVHAEQYGLKQLATEAWHWSIDGH